MDGLSVPMHGFRVLTGTGNRALAESIAGSLGVELCKCTVNRFADGEVFVRIDENIRGADVFIVQPTNPPAENMLELLLLVDAVRRASAARITVVLPYYGYARPYRRARLCVANQALYDDFTRQTGIRINRIEADADPLIERMRAERRASGEASFFYREVAFNADAVKVMPGGSTRLATYQAPYPIFIRKAQGCEVTDADGTTRIDFINNQSALVHGPSGSTEGSNTMPGRWSMRN